MDKGCETKIHPVNQCLWCKSKNLEAFARRDDGIGIVGCRECQLYMVDQIPDNIDEYYYQEDYFNSSNAGVGYSGVYDLRSPGFLLWQTSLIEESYNAPNKKNLLEIGCATGGLLEILREIQPNLSTQGIDISEYAIWAALQKGLDAQVAPIEKYSSKPRQDIIFSAETLEHLEDLKSFLQGVKDNLKPDGVFLFYVPSICLDDARREGGHYVRFRTNLEHTLHFIPEFFENELPTFFNQPALVREIKTSYGPCIIGAVSSNSESLENLERILRSLVNEKLPARSSSNFMKNLVILALKFGKPEFADVVLQRLEKAKKVDSKTVNLLNGLRGYHSGDLQTSTLAFQEYLKAVPNSLIALRALLYNARELDRIHTRELEELREIESKLVTIKQELRTFKRSRVIRAILRANIILNKGHGILRRFIGR